VQEVGEEVELGGVPVALGRCPASGLRPGVAPPLARSLARLRDHRVDEHEPGKRRAGCHERRREPPERLGHEHGVVALAYGVEHQLGVFG
jgi:hypothetical protein